MTTESRETGLPPTKQRLIPGKVTKTGNTRISKKPAMVIGGLLLVIALVFIFSDALKPKANAQSMRETTFPYSGHGDTEAEVLASAPQAGMIGRTELPQETPLIPTATQETAQGYRNTAPSPYEQMQYQQWQRQQQEALQAEQERQEQIENAHESKTTVFSSDAFNKQSVDEQPEANRSLYPKGNPSFHARASYQQNGNANYLLSTRVQALSPNEIKAGTIIPATLMAGINSQLPGDIIAQVTANVYDSATGQLLLIPQGAKLFGRYDHQVVLGQERVLIAWNRIIYPDSSSLDIEGMAGHDAAGYAGFKDKVNHHTASVFRRALLMSAITAGAQLSQPRARSGDYSYSSQQVLAASLGMNLNQLGMLTMQNRMNISPTITIRPGYRFNVMVNKDMILPVWESAAGDDQEFYTVSR